MRSAYVEDIYYDDANVRITNLNVYYGGNSRALRGIRAARTGVFRPVDEARNSLIGSGIMLLGIIPMLIFFTKGVYSLDDLFTWLLSAYALIGIINLVQGVRNIMKFCKEATKNCLVERCTGSS